MLRQIAVRSPPLFSEKFLPLLCFKRGRISFGVALRAAKELGFSFDVSNEANHSITDQNSDVLKTRIRASRVSYLLQIWSTTVYPRS